MVAKPISQLVSVSGGLTGNEQVPLNQGGATKRASVNDWAVPLAAFFPDINAPITGVNSVNTGGSLGTSGGVTVQLVNDVASPGVSKYYGTDSGGARGWYALTLGTVQNIATGSGLTGGPITISGTIAVATNGITDGLIAQRAGLSVMGRSATTSGNVADIVAASDGQVLRVSGSALGFGSVQVSSLAGVLAIVNGGTGASAVSGARTNFGLGVGDTPTFNGVNVTGNISQSTTNVDLVLRGNGNGFGVDIGDSANGNNVSVFRSVGVVNIGAATANVNVNSTTATGTVALRPGSLPAFEAVGVASAVNNARVTSAATGNRVVVEAVGSDTNIGLTIQAKGTGTLRLPSTVDLTSGQITFPATQVPSTDANTLDDYEEGTWTPVLTFATPGDLSVSYTLQLGTYTKIGRFVALFANIVTSAFTHTTASGNLNITGVPFSSITSTNTQAHGATVWGGITKASYTDLATFLPFNGSTTVLASMSGSGVAASNVQTVDMPTGGTVVLRFTLPYQTAA